jgi:predicted TIM-barrel fold metal-dependent hydrolase
MPIIDIYGHVSLPRFLATEEFLAMMDENDVEAAVLSTAETCPDIQELSRARRAHPDRFRIVGMPLGADAAGIRAGLREQLDSGFSGIRLPAAFIAANPDCLDLIGAAGAFVIVVGERGLQDAAAPVADFLDRFPASFAIAGHFGGPADPGLLDTDPGVRRLFDHPSLHVAFTRHGALRHLPLEAWAAALVRRVGWNRVLWGSEWPVALWRNETYQSTLDWALRLGPTASELEAFRYGNARRLLFARQAAAPRPLALDLMAFRRPADVWLFPPSLDLSENRHRRLHQAYVAWGGDKRGLYSEFVLQMAERGIATVAPVVR